MFRKFFTIISILLIATFVLTACGTPAAEEPEEPPVGEEPQEEEPQEEQVVIEWWHITTADEQKAVWQKLADEYMDMHPNVTINITVLENENFKTKMTTMMQAGTPPDIFQSWGGGTLIEYAKAGLMKDITPSLMRTAVPGVTPLHLVRLVYLLMRAKTMACRGTWAWLESGTTKTSLLKLGLKVQPRPGNNFSQISKP